MHKKAKTIIGISLGAFMAINAIAIPIIVSRYKKNQSRLGGRGGSEKNTENITDYSRHKGIESYPPIPTFSDVPTWDNGLSKISDEFDKEQKPEELKKYFEKNKKRKWSDGYIWFTQENKNRYNYYQLYDFAHDKEIKKIRDYWIGHTWTQKEKDAWERWSKEADTVWEKRESKFWISIIKVGKHFKYKDLRLTMFYHLRDPKINGKLKWKYNGEYS